MILKIFILTTLCAYVSCQMKDDGTCVPNSNFMIDCNNCFCTPSGLPACTLKACPETLRKLLKRQVLPQAPADGTCIEGQSYKVDCNTCRCVNKRLGFCTKRSCPPPSTTPIV